MQRNKREVPFLYPEKDSVYIDHLTSIRLDQYHGCEKAVGQCPTFNDLAAEILS